MAWTFDANQIVSISLLTLTSLGVIGLYIYIGLSAGKLDSANEVSKQIAIIGGTTGTIVLLFTILSYYYFTTNPNSSTAYLLISQGVNLFLSLFALSVASIQVFHS